MRDLQVYDLIAQGDLTILGEHVFKLPFDIRTAVALIIGVFLGVVYQLALVLVAASNYVFFFYRIRGNDEYASLCSVSLVQKNLS